MSRLTQPPAKRPHGCPTCSCEPEPETQAAFMYSVKPPETGPQPEPQPVGATYGAVASHYAPKERSR